MQRLLAATACLFLLGCPDESPKPDSSVPREPDARPKPPSGPRYEHCAGLGHDQPIQAAKLFGLQLTADGALLKAARSQSKRLVLGVVADTKEALPKTLGGLDRLAAWYRRMGASAVVLLGGIDPTFEGTREVINRLKRAAPVLALPGDRVSRSGFQAAVEAHQPQAVDLVRVRAISCPGLLGLVAVPGYHLPHHLRAKEQGCSYDEGDIRKLVGLARRLPEPRLLLAHGPPRGDGPNAVDRAFGAVNIGDPLLRRLIREGKIAFGLFAHVHESAGHATTVDGKTVPENTWSESLLLNVGSADSVPHEDLAGGWSKGSAALFEMHRGRARYRVVNLTQLPKLVEKKDEKREIPKGGN